MRRWVALCGLVGLVSLGSGPAGAAPPPTPRQAREVVDLDALPRLKPADGDRDLGEAGFFMSKAGIAEAADFYRAELTKRGWAEQSSLVPEAVTAQYADLLFRKQGFWLRASIGAGGDGTTSVSLSLLGPADLTALPLPVGAKPLGKPHPLNAHYLTTDGVDPAMARFRKELTAAGWVPYADFDDVSLDNEKSKTQMYLKDVTPIQAMANRNPQVLDGQTMAGYISLPVLRFGVPLLPGTEDLKLDIHTRRFACTVPGAVADVAAKLREAAPALGWKDVSHPPETTAERAHLLFDDGDTWRTSITLDGKTAGVVKVTGQVIAKRALELAEAKQRAEKPEAEAMPPARPATPETDPAAADLAAKIEAEVKGQVADVAAQMKAQTGIDIEKELAGVLPGGKPPEVMPAPGTPTAPAAVELEDADGLPIPKDNTSRSTERTPFRSSVEVTWDSTLKDAAALYRKALAERGWAEQPTAFGPARLMFAAPGRTLTLALDAAGDQVTARLLERRPDELRKMGLEPPAGRARLAIGNQLDEDVTVLVNGAPFPVARRQGEKDVQTAFKLDLYPGLNKVALRRAGKPDQVEDVKAAAGEAWGFVILADGNVLAVPLY